MKTWFIRFIAAILFSYISLGLSFYAYYVQPSIPLINTFIPYFSVLEPHLAAYKFQNLYTIEKFLDNSTRSDFLLDFSKADLKYKDSVVNLAVSDNLILEDRLKRWRKFKIIDDSNEIRAEFKLHGSSLYPYTMGYESFTIKSDMPVNGRVKFKLITGLEMDFNNIFYNYCGRLMNLITEDTGDIVVTNSMGDYRDFFQYSVFDEDYLEQEFDLYNAKILRRLTFNSGRSNWHSSMLDGVSYNLDLDSISKKSLNLWNTFLSSPEDTHFDPTYMGRFFALLQLYNFPHQIVGNNDKWVLSQDSLFYPVFREEAGPYKMTAGDIENNEIFYNYYNSESLDTYKKILVSLDVFKNRNLAFKHLIEMQDLILNSYDSIYNLHKEKHKSFGPNYLKTSLDKQRIKSILKNNLEIVKNYLDSGYTIIIYDGDVLRIKSSRKNTIRVGIGSDFINFDPIME